ncbi:YbaB/EbfC family nucleoid-associated protein [Saccharopolyspora sp. CA-218241]|uniref:YbaB/EbfC family nucleoid-associated protein n=1 Tax=Saccharopolyspora sp. CA-218241 TaxID=3240027 RepID=UPI003D9959C0
MPEDIRAVEQMVRQWQDRAAEKAERFGRMQSRVEDIQVTESSRDGAVRVTVSSSGMLQHLELAESAGNRPMAALSAEIMRTVQAAQARIPELMQEAVAETVGLEDSAAQHVLGEARRHFPEPPEEPEDEPPSRRPGLRDMEIEVEEDADPAPPPARPQPPQTPHPQTPKPPPPRPRPSGPDDDDDGDFSDESFLR